MRKRLALTATLRPTVQTGRERSSLLIYDSTLAWAGLLLLAIGLVMVYSASIAMAEASAHTGYRPWYFLVRHALFVGAGLVAALVAFQVPVKAWQRIAPWAFALGLVLLIAVLIPGVGKSVNGARRWLPLFIVSVQPSEFVKLAVVLYAASYAVRKAALIHAEQPLKQTLLRGFAPLLAVMVITGSLLVQEPDFGAFVVIVAIAFGILFLGGLDWRLFLGLAMLLPVALTAIMIAAPYRLQRLSGFLDPWADPLHKGYQLSHSLIAFGRGEWFGVGLGSSVEKLLYLPEAHTDFLLAVIAEELGFVGVAFVIALFVWILYRAYAIGRQAARLERPFAALVAWGIGVWIGVQTFINMGVNMGVLPTKGLTLPFLSFGGSGIVANCVALAILLRIDYENRRLLRGFAA
ncbi:MAG: putative lipid II flippase FtsW [Betaproteobacteria bacterium]|nr:MAG: putative lipid II flippase FtsW [Betaproteobacteria bacterium]